MIDFKKKHHKLRMNCFGRKADMFIKHFNMSENSAQYNTGN